MPVLAEIDSSWAAALILAGLIALVFTLGRLIRRHSAGVPGAGAAPPGGPSPADAERRLRETAERLMAEIESLGREMRGQVETRVRVLNELLARTDETISRIEGAERPPAPPRFEEVYRLADDGLEPPSIAERTTFEQGEVELILSLRRRARGEAAPDGGNR